MTKTDKATKTKKHKWVSDKQGAAVCTQCGALTTRMALDPRYYTSAKDCA